MSPETVAAAVILAGYSKAAVLWSLLGFVVGYVIGSLVHGRRGKDRDT